MIINGLSAITGGGLRYLINLTKIVPENFSVKLLLNEKVKNEFTKSDKNVDIITFKVTNIFKRIILEQFWIPLYVRRKNIDLLYSPADMASFLAGTNQIMGVQNPNPYYNLNVKYSVGISIKIYY